MNETFTCNCRKLKFEVSFIPNVRIRSFFGPHFPAFGLNTGSISPYSSQMQENTDQENSEYKQRGYSICFLSLTLRVKKYTLVCLKVLMPWYNLLTSTVSNWNECSWWWCSVDWCLKVLKIQKIFNKND